MTPDEYTCLSTTLRFLSRFDGDVSLSAALTFCEQRMLLPDAVSFHASLHALDVEHLYAPEVRRREVACPRLYSFLYHHDGIPPLHAIYHRAVLNTNPASEGLLHVHARWKAELLHHVLRERYDRAMKLHVLKMVVDDEPGF